MKIRHRAIGFKRGRPIRPNPIEFEAGVLRILEWVEGKGLQGHAIISLRRIKNV